MVFRPANAKQSVTLYRTPEGAKHFRDVTASILDDGRLDVSAQDMGPTVEEIWGDSDYEFGVRLSEPDKQRLCLVLQPATPEAMDKPQGETADLGLLAALEVYFGGRDDALDELIALLDELDITYERWSWA